MLPSILTQQLREPHGERNSGAAGASAPPVPPLAPVIAVVALGRAPRRAGAAAAETVLAETVLGEDAYRGAINPDNIPAPNLPPEGAVAPEWLPKHQDLGLARKRMQRYAVVKSFIWSICAGCGQMKV